MNKYIITLTKSKRSKALSNKMIKQAKSVGITDIEIHPATDRYTAWQRYVSDNFKINDIRRFGAGFISSEIATFFSHFDLWEKCIKLNEPILILEHDAWFKTNPLNNIDSHITEKTHIINLGIPNWGSMWSGEYPSDRKWLHESKGVVKRDICKKKHDIFKVWNKKEGLCHCDRMWLFGAHSYIITPNGASMLINETKNGILPADIFIRQDIAINIYDYFPLSVKQQSKKSFIQRDKETNSTDQWDY